MRDPSNMKLSPQGKAAIFAHEGCVLSRYKDSVGVWTIGIGVTSAAGASINPNTFRGEITLDEAFDMFDKIVPKYAKYIQEAVTVPLDQHEFDALVSIIWNIGPKSKRKPPTFIKRLNAGDRSGAAKAIMFWKKPAEIIPRRRGEMELFRDGTYPAPYVNLYKASSSGKVLWGTGKRIDLSYLIDASVKAPSKMPVSTGPEWWQDDDEVLQLQVRLHELNYTEVGKTDGKWGKWTRGALLRFKADNDLPLNTDLNDQTRIALYEAEPDDTHLQRANSTPESSRISAASLGQIVTGGGVVTGAVAKATGGSPEPATVTSIIGKAEELQGTAERVGGIVGWLTNNPIVDMFSGLGPMLPYVVGIAGALVVFLGWQANKARIEDYRSGKTR